MIDLPDSLPPAPPPPPRIVIELAAKGQMNVQVPEDLDLAEIMLTQVMQKIVEQRVAQKQTVVQAVAGMVPPPLALLRNGRR